MGNNIFKTIEGACVFVGSVFLGLVGIEVGMDGAGKLYDHIEYITGNAPNKIEQKGNMTISTNQYTNQKSVVHYDLKSDSYKSNFFQPKGYTKFN